MELQKKCKGLHCNRNTLTDISESECKACLETLTPGFYSALVIVFMRLKVYS